MTPTILFDTPDARIERRHYASRRLSLLSRIFVERGDLTDWKALHELHYKAANLGIGPRYWRATLEGETIGIIVLTVPKPLDSGRNQVFPHLKPNVGGRDNRMINQQRMHWINKNLILCSRQVLDTMYRGAGIAYRFRNLAFRMQGTRFVESRSAMSKFNPFYQKTGMKLLAPKKSASHDAGVAFFTRNFVSAPYDQVALMEELAAMPEHVRSKVELELRAFYYKHSSMEKSGDNRLRGTSRVDSATISYLLKQTQQLVFGSTIYAVWKNPDWDETTLAMRPAFPTRLPLLAFDLQGPNEPLRLDLLESPK